MNLVEVDWLKKKSLYAFAWPKRNPENVYTLSTASQHVSSVQRLVSQVFYSKEKSTLLHETFLAISDSAALPINKKCQFPVFTIILSHPREGKWRNVLDAMYCSPGGANCEALDKSKLTSHCKEGMNCHPVLEVFINTVLQISPYYDHDYTSWIVTSAEDKSVIFAAATLRHEPKNSHLTTHKEL